jgi:hypothetical protein
MDIKLEPGELIMGVGNGGGNLFVKGDYESITTLQNKLFEWEKSKREIEELKEEVEELLKEVRENDQIITRLKLELAMLKSEKTIERELPKPGFIPPYSPSNPFGPFCEPCPTKYPDAPPWNADRIWYTQTLDSLE